MNDISIFNQMIQKLAFTQLYVHRVFLVNSDVRDNLNFLSGFIGGFLYIIGIGENSVSIAATTTHNEKNITQLILFDPGADLITPLIVAMDYEGLLSDFRSLEDGFLTLSNKKQIIINSIHDQILSQLRMKNWIEVSHYISELTNKVKDLDSEKLSGSLKESHETFKKVAEKALELKTYSEHSNVTGDLLNKMKLHHFFNKMMNAEAKVF